MHTCAASPTPCSSASAGRDRTPIMSRDFRVDAGCGWTTWTSWCTSSIRRRGASTSSSASGGTHRSSSRAASRRLRAALLPALLLLAALPGSARAQYYFDGYFGQNKVQYNTFDFQVMQTDHFDVHFYPSERRAALAAAQMAERSYARLSRILNHRFTERKIIVLYA